jgi:hypothetical protein
MEQLAADALLACANTVSPLLHFCGCRHNGRTLGYEPWNVGFSESWFPPMASEDALVS